MRSLAPHPAPVCSAGIARWVLGAAAAAGADARELAREARLPAWVLADDEAMVPSRDLMRLWELAERETAEPDLPLALASQLAPGKLGLYGYLVTTAATLRHGLRAGIGFIHLVSTCSRVRIEAETSQETTYSCRPVGEESRGAQLGLQFCVASFCALARAGGGRPVAPVRVGFAQPAPRSHHAFTKSLGTRRIDFGTPVTTFTFHARDLDLPMPRADPILARILHRYAATMPPPPITWLEQFRQALDEAIGQDGPSLDDVAGKLAVSPRTLQRRLAEHGTTWRTEVDAARQDRARLAHKDGRPSMTGLARQLGYAGPRSARRALQRWNDAAGSPD